MKRIDLNGIWRLSDGDFSIDAEVPGSVVSALLADGRIPDPYEGSNEAAVQPLFDADYTYSRTFLIAPEDLTYPSAILRCDGLDTLCRIDVNGSALASTDNMHCRYDFEIRHLLHVGENRITLVFASPVQCLNNATTPVGPQFYGLRKAACMFGWDWGIRLPDSGIWRDIALELRRHARLLDVEIRQEHAPERVDLRIHTRCALYDRGVLLRLRVTDPQGKTLYDQTGDAAEDDLRSVAIQEPQLWWPNGYGAQPLYRVSAELLRDGVVLEAQSHEIGLRTVTLDRGAENCGDYRFFINGVPIYVKGASIVIEDAILSRSTPERWERIVRDAVRSNYNTLRVWGGAYYPPDCFYTLCDRAGLLVYQDLMFACRIYWPDKAFLDSIETEISQTAVRLRNHPCLCLWCGNNEVDFFYTAFTSDDPETAAIREFSGMGKFDETMRETYRKMYEPVYFSLIPRLLERLSPDVGYVHSSPSAGDSLGAESIYAYFEKGDAHYYNHVDRDAPYRKLEQFHIRFLSEYGFQSYPSLKTLWEYLPADALRPDSEAMLVHQKRKDGNRIIERYLSRDFFVPEKFSDYVYMSQMMAGEILRHTVEHLRRDRDFNRGVLLWQHNDCWPVVSWSGVDYCGRWKGQQYYVRRLFAPVLVSARIDGDAAALFVVNDLLRERRVRLDWTLYQDTSAVLSGSEEVTLAPQSAEKYAQIDLSGVRRGRAVLAYSVTENGAILSRGSQLLVEQNRFSFARPTIRANVSEKEGAYRITLRADCFVKSVCLDLSESDALFSDNFFDLLPDAPYTVSVRREDFSEAAATDDLRRQLTLDCVNAVACGEGPVDLIWKEAAP